MYITEECLLSYKNWCIVLVTFLSVPLCLFCWAVNLDLAWTYYFTGILIASSVVPIAFSIVWARATAKGKSILMKTIDLRNPKIKIISCQIHIKILLQLNFWSNFRNGIWCYRRMCLWNGSMVISFIPRRGGIGSRILC